MSHDSELMQPEMLQTSKAQQLHVRVTHLAGSSAGAGCWLHLRFCLRCSTACLADGLEVPLTRTCTMQGFMASHRHKTLTQFTAQEVNFLYAAGGWVWDKGNAERAAQHLLCSFLV